MTRDEFEAGYAARSGITIEQLRAVGRVVRPCTCDDEHCEGWQSVRVDEGDEWPEHSPHPKSDARY